MNQVFENQQRFFAAKISSYPTKAECLTRSRRPSPLRYKTSRAAANQKTSRFNGALQVASENYPTATRLCMQQTRCSTPLDSDRFVAQTRPLSKIITPHDANIYCFPTRKTSFDKRSFSSSDSQLIAAFFAITFTSHLIHLAFIFRRRYVYVLEQIAKCNHQVRV